MILVAPVTCFPNSNECSLAFEGSQLLFGLRLVWCIPVDTVVGCSVEINPLIIEEDVSFRSSIFRS